MIELDLLTMCNENLSKIITTIFSCQPRNRSLMGVVNKDTFLFSQRTDAVSLSLFLYIVDMEGWDVLPDCASSMFCVCVNGKTLL